MSENKSKFNIKYVNANIGDVYYRFAEFFLYKETSCSCKVTVIPAYHGPVVRCNTISVSSPRTHLQHTRGGWLVTMARIGIN